MFDHDARVAQFRLSAAPIALALGLLAAPVAPQRTAFSEAPDET